MAETWQNWCRLCAKFNGNDIDVFLKLESVTELSVLVQKYLLISITPFDDTPTAICSDCFKFVSQLEKFALRCNKVDKMFTELVYDKINNVDNEINMIRYKYNLDEEEKNVPVDLPVTVRLKIHQATDTLDLLEKQNFDVIQIKEEFHSENLTMTPQTRKKRGRPKKIEGLKSEQIVIKQEHDSINIDDDSPPQPTVSARPIEDLMDYADDVEDNHSFENEIDDIELQKEMDELIDDDSSSESEKRVSKRTRRRKKMDEEIEIISCPVPECNITFNRRRSYELHMRTKHPDPETLYNCSGCSKTFTSEKKLRLHEATHLPQSVKMTHPCPYCDKKFTKAVNVQAHIRAIHIGDRPFICEECGKSFVAKGALKEHQIIHSDERPFQCAHCPKKFKNLPRLKTHEDIHNETTYVCPHCGLLLNTKRTLKMHMVVHSDQKKYKCQYCGNEYKRSKALKNHLILHTGLRPYICPFCDKTFANGSNCRSHKKKSHPMELAALEASGEAQRIPNIPKLENLQPKQSKVQQQIQGILEQKPTIKSEGTPERPASVSSPPQNTPNQLISSSHNNGMQSSLASLLTNDSIIVQVSNNLQQQSPISNNLQQQSPTTPLISTSNL